MGVNTHTIYKSYRFHSRLSDNALQCVNYAQNFENDAEKFVVCVIVTHTF